MGVEFQTKMSTLIGRLNRLVNKTFTSEHFISMVFAEFTDSDNGLVSYVNAGHCFPIILHAATGQIEELGATGQIIGPFPTEKYRTEFTIMHRGDIMILYTDGIVEASNEKREMYGEQRLIAKLKEFKAKSPKAICQLIIEDVQVHNRLIDYSDDKTIVIIRRSR
jgi:sigma-B regulation protein RsbU (phosphoserine phosphatase)